MRLSWKDYPDLLSEVNDSAFFNYRHYTSSSHNIALTVFTYDLPK